MQKPDTVIVDLDGTLSDSAWRLEYLPKPEVRHLDNAWYGFNSLGAYDPPITSTIQVVNALYDAGYRVVILTGRGEATRDITEAWLENKDVQYNCLIMRPVGCCALDKDFKLSALRDIGGSASVLCAFEDLPHIVDMWREQGITTYAVRQYNSDDAYVKANNKQGVIDAD